MPTRDIKTRFVLEGEQAFKKAMSDSASSIKVLNSEQKLAKAQFEATGDAQEYAAERARILKEEIEQQKKAVAAAENAVKALTERGVEPSSKEMQTWKTRLNNARTALVQMETQLDAVGDELGEESTAFGSASEDADGLKESIDKVGEKVDYQNVISAIDSITGALEKAWKNATRAAAAVWGIGAQAGQWADDIKTASEKLGIDAETYQSWQYASTFIDTNVEDITRSWQDIQKNLKENNTEYLKTLAKLRVATKNTDGTMRSSEEVFWDVIDALHNIKDPTEQAQEATKIFGNDWRNLVPLINSGSAAYKDLAKEGRHVAVVSNANVDKLGKVDDSMSKLALQAQKLKNDALAGLSPSFVSVSEGLGKAATALQEFLESAEGQAAIEGLNAAVQGLVDAFLGDDNGKSSFEGIINTAKSAVNGFTDALKWVSENGQTVKKVIMGLGVAWAGLKISKGVLEFMTLLNATPLAKLTTLFGGGAAKAAAPAVASSGAAATGAAPGILAAAAPVVLPAAAMVAVTAGAGAALDAAATAREQAHYASADAVQETREQAEGLNTELAEAARSLADFYTLMSQYGTSVDGVKEIKDALLAMSDADLEKLHAIAPDLKLWEQLGDVSAESMRRLMGTWNEEWQGWDDTMIDASGVMDIARDAMDKIGERFDSGEFADVAKGGVEGFVEGVESGVPDVEQAGGDIGGALTNGAMAALDEHSPSRVFETIGGNAAVGLANGIYARGDEAIRAARWLADSVASVVQSALDIHSPSKVFERFGSFTGLGFAHGIEGSIDSVNRAVDAMLGATVRRPMLAFGGAAVESAAVPSPGSRAASGAAPGTVHVTMVLDEETVGDVLAPIVNEKIGAKIQATRR